MNDRPKIHHILCSSFHGSSVLCMLLNNHSRVRAIADGNPLRGPHNCLCGKTFFDCDFWTHMRAETGYAESEPYECLIPSMPRFTGSESLDAKINHVLCHLAFLLGPFVWKLAGRPAEIFRAKYEAYVRGACGYSGSGVLVDAEKNYLKTFCWASMGQPLDGILYLVRDPRAFAASGMKGHQRDDASFYGRKWSREHRIMRHYMKFLPPEKILTLRYEDLTADPAAALARVFSFLGVAAEDVFHPAENGRKNHMYGNVAIKAFDGRIRPNDKWKSALDAAQQEEVMKLTYPLSARYGYK